MRSKWLALAAVVLLTAALAYAVGGWGHGWKKGAGMPGGAPVWREGAYWNATLYSATRQLTLSGDGVEASLTVDVVSRDASVSYGRIVYGTGVVKLGGVSYEAKSVFGVLGQDALRLTVYTGQEVIMVRYFNGTYFAVVKPFGTTGCQRFGGSAVLTVS
jgi:hypothetical protein